MSEMILERCGSTVRILPPEWTDGRDSTYECRVLLCPEPEGGFSVHAIRLPGVVSEGDTESEALENIADAFRSAIQSYLEGGSEIPWCDEKIDRPKGSKERWILVDV
ncbi:MAG: type II toxin-antitoxin system HicB family antitoxin [Planctomycetes bacterium]|nr:type II toxin-antitoxin system HicB family antitoxin [Planctomycetota bacterium]